MSRHGTGCNPKLCNLRRNGAIINSMRARVGIALASILATLLAVPGLQAQRGASQSPPRGIPGSVTSFGFGGRRTLTPGVPASVTSQGFGTSGVSCGNGMLISSAMGCPNPFFQSTIVNGQVRLGPFNNNGHRRHHGVPTFSPYPFYGYGYGGMYIDSSDYANYANPNGAGAFTPGYQPPEEQPPVQVIVMPAQSAPPAAPSSAYAPPQNPASAQPEQPAPPENIIPTVLVFKDGHQQEVRNYAIVGQTLYVVESFTSRKIPLSDLDLKATEKANEESGVEFVLPAGAKK